MTTQVLVVFAFVFFVVAAFLNPGAPNNPPWWGRVHLGWLGLACWVATLIFK